MEVEILKRRECINQPYYKERKVIYGGFKGNMNWKYYLTGFESDMHERLESIKHYVDVFYSDMINEFRSTRFCEKYFFLFDDNFAISFTLRTWGDFMAAYENKDQTYLDFYGIPNIIIH